jgi:hypothetical protein
MIAREALSVWQFVNVDGVWRNQADIEDGRDQVFNIEQTAVDAFAMLHSALGEKRVLPG